MKRLAPEGTANEGQHPDTYEVRPRETVELSITRGTFDVNYLR